MTKTRPLLPGKGQLKPYVSGICKTMCIREKKIFIIFSNTGHMSNKWKQQAASSSQHPKGRESFAWSGDQLWNSFPLCAVNAVFTAEFVQNDGKNLQINRKKRTLSSSQEVSYVWLVGRCSSRSFQAFLTAYCWSQDSYKIV